MGVPLTQGSGICCWLISHLFSEHTWILPPLPEGDSSKPPRICPLRGAHPDPPHPSCCDHCSGRRVPGQLTGRDPSPSPKPDAPQTVPVSRTRSRTPSSTGTNRTFKYLPSALGCSHPIIPNSSDSLLTIYHGLGMPTKARQFRKGGILLQVFKVVKICVFHQNLEETGAPGWPRQ